MAGLIHIYCGNGKGKTTAGVGLSVRAAGAGKNVVFTQFFKNGTSSEVKILSQIPNIRTMHCTTSHGFYAKMNQEQREKAKADYGMLLEEVLEAGKDADLLVLDEAISACNHGTIDEEILVEFLRHKPESLEVVMTGRGPSQELLDCADYVTEMKKIKHPFDRGIHARKGIEF